MVFRPTTSRSPRRGLTMVEILVTLVVVTFLFIPIFSLIQLAQKMGLRGGDESLATVYAADVIELVRGGPYEAFFKDGGNPDKALPLNEVFARSNFFKGYDWEKYDKRFHITVSVSAAGDIEPAKMKQVVVEVAWDDKVTQKPRGIKLATFYSPANL
jgi:hypothetical protein